MLPLQRLACLLYVLTLHSRNWKEHCPLLYDFQSKARGRSVFRIKFDNLLGAEEDSNTKAESLEYNGYVMNPLKANASVSCLWELELLSHHFHPSVALFASNLLDICETPTYSGRPLVDFSLASFLERFSQRKPKAGVVSARVIFVAILYLVTLVRFRIWEVLASLIHRKYSIRTMLR